MNLSTLMTFTDPDQPIDLRGVVTNVIEARRAQFESREHALTMYLGANPVIVTAGEGEPICQ